MAHHNVSKLASPVKILKRKVTDKIDAKQNELSAPCARKTEECDVNVWKIWLSQLSAKTAANVSA